MGLVNPPQITPGVMRSLYRLCVALGQDATATTDEYVDLLAPASAVVVGKDPKAAARSNVREAQRLGLLADGGGGRWGLNLPAPEPGASQVDADRLFVRELRRLVLSAQNNDPLFHEGEPDDDEAEREAGEQLSTQLAREFTRIQAWVLLRDPTAPTLHMTHADETRNIDRLQTRYKARKLVVNATRWASFRRWSVFLGFSRLERLAGPRQAAGLIADPTRAVTDELAEMARSAEELPLVDVRARLAEALPVLDQGNYRAKVADHVGADADREDALSGALALALLRAERAGMLSLVPRADFGRTVTVADRPYSHVVFGGAGA